MHRSLGGRMRHAVGGDAAAEASPWTLLETWPAIASWTLMNGATVAQDSVLDPVGGFDAIIVTDDSGTLIESISRTGTTVLVVGQQYRFRVAIKKDAVAAATRSMELQLKASGSVFADLDTSTGNFAVRVASGFTGIAVASFESPAGWLVAEVVFTANVATPLQAIIIPAVGTGVPATVIAGTTGSMTFYPRATLEKHS